LRNQVVSHLVYAGSALVLLPSCEEQLLDFPPQTEIEDGDIIFSQSSAEQALVGVYTAAKSTSGTVILTFETAADNVLLNSLRTVVVPTLRADGGVTGGADRTDGGGYGSYYRLVNRANHVISAVNGLDDALFKTGGKERILAEAYTLRAFAYFDLVRTYANVPLVLIPASATNLNGVKKSPKADVFKQVESDLDIAERLLDGTGWNGNKGRVSIWAVYAFKARLYLYQERWQEAETYASKLTDNPDLALTPLEAGDNWFETRFSSEGIFEIACSTTEGNPVRTNFATAAEGGLGDYIANPDLADLLNDPNVGGKRSIYLKYEPSITAWLIQTYNKPDGSSSVFLFRLAEQYLIRAEARLKKAAPDVQGAIADINKIKERAGIPLIDTQTPPSVTDLLLVVENENRYEFAFEGHRYPDIIRTKRAAEVFGALNPIYKDPRYWVVPLPTSELKNDPDLEQNGDGVY
ncbi:MAG: RagB/SusD family nutrient uptake outer membrane protein, partial [Tannerellaceae bacterium]|nr:RagB/SusD family nutrient uptake outer membrane protein [Tannerellaceae bacterium]